MPDAQELSYATCADLLSSGEVGRIAFATPNGPEVIPVNYVVIDASVVVRTSPYGVLGTFGRGAQAAFEIDHLDHDAELGWSVVAHGRLTHLTDPIELERVQSTWKPRPWASGASRHLYLRLTWDKLTGRRLGLASARAPQPRA